MTRILVMSGSVTTVNIVTAKAHLSELVGKAERGEVIEIERHGKPVARLGPAVVTREPIDFEWLGEITRQIPRTEPDSVERLRKDDRY